MFFFLAYKAKSQLNTPFAEHDLVRGERNEKAHLLSANSGDLAAAMERWTGVLSVPLSRGGRLFRVAASLILAPSKSLAVRINAGPPALVSSSGKIRQ